MAESLQRKTVRVEDEATTATVDCSTSGRLSESSRIQERRDSRWTAASKRGSRLCAELDLALDRKLKAMTRSRRGSTGSAKNDADDGEDDEEEAESDGADDDDEDHNNKNRRTEGGIMDFLKRLKGTQQLKETIAFARMLRKSRNKKGDGKMNLGFKQALDQVQLEALSSELMEHITLFWKSGEAKAHSWKRCGNRQLKEVALTLVQWKREVACLESEVHNWLIRFRLLHRASHYRDENSEERRKRLQTFWTEYHATSRKMEVQSTVSLKLSPKMHHSKISPKNRSTSMNWASDGDSYLDAERSPAWSTQDRSSSPAGRGQASRGLSKSTSLPSLHSSGTRRAGAKTMAMKNSHGSPSKSQGEAFLGTSLPPIGGPESPTMRYLRVCQCNGIVPTPIPFVTGHSLKLNAGSKALVDTDLLAVAAMIPNVTRIEEVDLTGNGLLTEKAMVPFLQSLLRNTALQSMEKFSIRECRQFGHQTMDGLVKMLSLKDNGARSLVKLDLSGIPIAMKSFLPLCKAIRMHQHVKSVHLADVGLGRSIAAKRCIGELLGSTSMRELDLGWNSFDHEVFEHLGERLVEVERLQSLSMANCSVANNMNHDIPIIFFLEYLVQNKTLSYLDISLNRVDFRGALVVEDALEHHNKLLELNISYNPLGITGMRSVLRLLCRDHSSLMHFECDGCSTGTCSDSEIDDLQVFSVTNPGGRYKLDLTRPYHRTLLRMLYKTSERFELSPDQAFTDLAFSGGTYSHASKDIDGWQVQNTGNLAVTFSIERGMEKALKGVADCDFAQLLERHYNLMRIRPGFKKVVPLFAQWRTIDGHTLEQIVMLDALSKDFLLSFPQIHQLAKSRALVSDIITRLLHCVTGGQPARYLTMLLTPTLGEYVRNQRKLWNLLGFNVENPTGHYRLQLSMNSDHGVAESLMLLDRWEVSVDRRLGRVDISQKGNQSHVRNERYQDRDLHVDNIAEWNMPDCDVLEFDYVSSKRPPADAVPLSHATFNSILYTLFQHALPPKDNIEVLRLISHNIYFMALQLRELLGQFRYDCDRTELFVVFFMRVMDMCNEKVFRVRFTKPADLDVLRNRLGWATFFPFIQPEQAHFCLHFGHHDERIAISIVLALMAKERRSNLRNPVYVLEDGRVDPLPVGVPKSWETFERMPPNGVFSCDYSCAPEDRCFALRKKYLQMYGAWDTIVDEQDVMWWAALTEAPSDVLEYLEFLVSHYSNIAKAFVDIDGEDGNGVLTLREFEASVDEMKCKKFDGPDKAKRVESIFRYLDPSGEGEVSTEEFLVLELLWKEMQLSIREFVAFLERCFEDEDEEGLTDFLEDSWNFLDDDGSGEITEEEWSEAIVGKLKYFGPCKVIFSFIDKDDEGTVSLDEFMELRAFSTKLTKEDPL